MEVNNKNLYDRLLELVVIDAERLKTAFDLAEARGKDLVDYLYDMDLATDEQIGQIMADMYSVPYVRLDEQEIKDETLNLISEVFSKKQLIVAFKKDKGGLTVATSDPNNSTALDFVAKKVGMPLKICFSTSRNIKKFCSTL